MSAVSIGKITGPPGCGKTTELLRLITAACERYVPKYVGVVSFTNAAVQEVKQRISETGKIHKSAINNVRTLHSHCFRLLKLDKKQTAESHLSQFVKDNPQYPMTTTKSKCDDSIVNRQTEQYFNNLFGDMQILRNKMVRKDRWPTNVRELADTWLKWCQENDLTDFTGMLEKVLRSKLVPEIDILFVDEAQDLTPLQYEITRMWTEETTNTTYAGDSDQCIFRFSGAVPERFIQLDAGWRKHLEQSYRVPPAVHAYARRIAKRIGDREDTDFNPRTEDGPGRAYDCIEPDLSLDGDHMIICRCDYQVKRWINYLIEHKITWHNPYRAEDLSWNPHRTKAWMAVSTYQSLMNGRMVSGRFLKQMVGSMKAAGNMNRGVKKTIMSWQTPDVLDEKYDLFSMEALGFTDDAIRCTSPIDEMFSISGRSAPLLQHLIGSRQEISIPPKIVVGTIHSVKGAEADHVWLDTGIPPIVHNAITSSRRASYDEARVAYVAATRARKTLGLLRSRMRNPMLPEV